MEIDKHVYSPLVELFYANLYKDEIQDQELFKTQAGQEHFYYSEVSRDTQTLDFLNLLLNLCPNPFNFPKKGFYTKYAKFSLTKRKDYSYTALITKLMMFCYCTCG